MAGLTIHESVLSSHKKIYGHNQNTCFGLIKINDDRTQLTLDATDPNDPQENSAKTDPKANNFDYMLSRLPENSPRFIYYKLNYKIDDDGMLLPRDKLCIISYYPAKCHFRERTLLSMSKESFKRSVNFSGLEIHGAREKDVQIERVAKALQSMPSVKQDGVVKEIEGYKLTWDEEGQNCEAELI